VLHTAATPGKPTPVATAPALVADAFTLATPGFLVFERASQGARYTRIPPEAL
jgi:hypothetical protein